jgi:N-ethylmaleimide reductase
LARTFFAGGGFTEASGREAIRSGLADFIVYGKLFTSNPNLPERFSSGAELVAPNPATFYTPGPEGYTSYAAR